MTNKPLLIQFWGGPSSGKSIGAAGLYIYMATLNKYSNVGLVREFAKKYAIARDIEALKNQMFITGGQRNSLLTYSSEYEYLISDSAIELGITYCSSEEHLKFVQKSISDIYNMFTVINVFVKRNRKLDFEQSGRIHTHEESIKLDSEIRKIMELSCTKYGSKCVEWETSKNVEPLYKKIEEILKNINGD
jgi:hypothetical protein